MNIPNFKTIPANTTTINGIWGGECAGRWWGYGNDKWEKWGKLGDIY